MAPPALPEDALFIVCCSGYAGKAEQVMVMMVSLSVANACREQRPWTLKAKPGLPLQLLSWHLLGGDRPSPQPKIPKAAAAAAGGGGGSGGLYDAAFALAGGENSPPAAPSWKPATAAAAAAAATAAPASAAAAVAPVSRLSPRRLVQRVLVDRSFSLDGIVWPSRVTSVEMGEEVVAGDRWLMEAVGSELNKLGHDYFRPCGVGEEKGSSGGGSSSSSSSKPFPSRGAESRQPGAAETPTAALATLAGMATFSRRVQHGPTPASAPSKALPLPLLWRAAHCEAFWAGRPAGTCFDRPTQKVLFPPTLLHLELLGSFDEPLDRIDWPPLLETLAFGEMFNQSLAGHGDGGGGGLLPRTLKSLTLGAAFDQPLGSVVWPPGLTHLQLGHYFNQDLRGVGWPASLAELYFGDLFRSPIAGVTWPESLRHLEFGHLFRQPLDGVVWPRGLEELRFGGYYNCSLEDAELPEGLRALDLGRSFNRPIEGTRFPNGLTVLTFGDSFNQPVERVKWPKCLQVLHFGSNFNQEIEGASFPDTLERLTFRQRFDRNIEGVKWPKHLRVLKFGNCFDKPIERVQWPPRLEILVLGHYFNHPIKHLKLPPTFRRIAFSGIFDQPLRRVEWPQKLERVELGPSLSSEETMDGMKWPGSFKRLTLKTCGGFDTEPRKVSSWLPSAAPAHRLPSLSGVPRSYPNPTGSPLISIDHPNSLCGADPCPRMARSFERLAPSLEVADKSLVHGVVHEGLNPGLLDEALADKLFSLPSFAELADVFGRDNNLDAGGGSDGGASGDKAAPEKEVRRRRRGRRGRGAGMGAAYGATAGAVAGGGGSAGGGGGGGGHSSQATAAADTA